MPEKDKTLEMRVAEIEDKLAQLHISDEEMKVFNKVAAAMGMQGGAESASAGGAAGVATSPSAAIPRFINRGIGPCRIRGLCICPCQCVCQCVCINECTCGPCAQGGGGGFGGGFGGFGS